ncbi:MAG: hypothetical protein DI498_10940 [Paracoccus denitrificans]|nr:MAG: hypothetical protein DI498_10940 [Paracoccus denitrificans]PZO83657.1 MAG: hypothetical protein DI633_10940 [Paracoccus denitrificans]
MPLDQTTPLTARIEVFRPGTFTPMEGAAITFSAADLRAVADSYDFATAPAPIVVGHPSADAPAYGWVESFDYDTKADRLFANLRDIDPSFAEAVRTGRYRKVSMAYFSPAQGHNPVPGTWYPKHLGFLGGAAPAVSGLKNAHFSGDAGVVFTTAFCAPGIEEAASLFRRMRDFLIDRFGLEDADDVLPSWQIEWMTQSGDESPSFTAPAAITPDSEPKPEPEKEPAVTQQPDPAFAAREADITAREARIAAREAEQAHADNASFAESLVQDGKLLPASKEKIVAILDALPTQASVSFAAGEDKLPPAAALKQVLEAQPRIVSFGALDLPEGEGGPKPAVFAADGKAVDPDGLARHQKALDYQRQHPGTDYMVAVRAVS